MTAINNAWSRLGVKSTVVRAHVGLYSLISGTIVTSDTCLFYQHLFEKNWTRIDEDSQVANLGAGNRSVPQTPTVA